MHAKVDDRKDYIGSTDAPAIVGVDPYRTPLAVYYEKTGALVPAPVRSDAAHFGTVLESVIAHEYAKRTGNKVRRVNRRVIHAEHRFIRAQIDRDVVGIKRQLEVKTAGYLERDKWGASGTDEVPERYLIQVQHALACTGNEVCDLAVLIGGQDFRIYYLPRDAEMIDNLIWVEHEFWKRVQTQDAPAISDAYPAVDIGLMRKLYPGTDGTRILLPSEAVHWHKVFQESCDAVKQYQHAAEAAKAHLMQMMGNAALGKIDGADGVYRRKLVKRKGYEVQPSEYIDFRMVKDK